MDTLRLHRIIVVVLVVVFFFVFVFVFFVIFFVVFFVRPSSFRFLSFSFYYSPSSLSSSSSASSSIGILPLLLLIPSAQALFHLSLSLSSTRAIKISAPQPLHQLQAFRETILSRHQPSANRADTEHALNHRRQHHPKIQHERNTQCTRPILT